MSVQSNLFSPLILFAEKDQKLAKAVAKKLNWPASMWVKREFANSEIIVDLVQTIRRKNVFIFYSTVSPINDSFFELFIALDAVKRSAPASVTLVAPFLGYGRQERRNTPREPITTALIAQMLEISGAQKIITIDPHSPSSLGFYNIPIEAISFQKSLLINLFEEKIKNFVLAFPDLGSSKKAESFVQKLNTEAVIFEKTRSDTNKTEMKLLTGDPAGKNVILIDDMIDTGSTIIQAITFLRKKKAKNIYILATHGIFSKSALTELKKLYQKKMLMKVLISDSYPRKSIEQYPFLKIVSLVNFLSAWLKADIQGESTTLILESEDKQLKKFANE